MDLKETVAQLISEHRPREVAEALADEYAWRAYKLESDNKPFSATPYRAAEVAFWDAARALGR